MRFAQDRHLSSPCTDRCVYPAEHDEGLGGETSEPFVNDLRYAPIAAVFSGFGSRPD